MGQSLHYLPTGGRRCRNGMLPQGRSNLMKPTEASANSMPNSEGDAMPANRTRSHRRRLAKSTILSKALNMHPLDTVVTGIFWPTAVVLSTISILKGRSCLMKNPLSSAGLPRTNLDLFAMKQKYLYPIQLKARGYSGTAVRDCSLSGGMGRGS